MTARLAVLTVVRDDLPGLIATHDSLCAQTARTFDWIVVDGASADGTAAWLDCHQSALTWWRSAPDGGLYDAMNVALDAALQRSAAGHIIYLNAGDRLAGPDTVERLVTAISESPHAGLLYGDALERLADGQLVEKPARSHRFVALGMFTHHQAMVYRRDAVADLRFDLRHRLAADYAFTLKLLQKGAPAIRMRFPVCVFAPGGASQRDPALGRREQALIRRELMGHGALATATVSALQWLALTMKRNNPGLYAKLRFR